MFPGQVEKQVQKTQNNINEEAKDKHQLRLKGFRNKKPNTQTKHNLTRGFNRHLDRQEALSPALKRSPGRCPDRTAARQSSSSESPAWERAGGALPARERL